MNASSKGESRSIFSHSFSKLLNYQLRTLMGRGSIGGTDDSIPFDPSATGTDNRSLLGYYGLPAFPGLLAVPLAGQTIGGADRFRAEHAFPSWIARALETHVAAKSENSIVSFLLIIFTENETFFTMKRFRKGKGKRVEKMR